jgi:hypothetical protein
MNLDNPVLYPVGTLVEIVVDGGSAENREPKIREVQYLVRNGLRSYVIHTGLKKEFLDGDSIDEGYNIAHVTRILRRGPKHARFPWGIRKTELVVKESYQHKPDVWAADIARMALPKARGAYRTIDAGMVVHYIVQSLLKYDQAYDSALLHSMLRDRGLIRYDDQHFLLPVRKKRLRKAIRQLLPRCLCNVEKAWAAQQEADNRAFHEDLDWLDHELDHELDIMEDEEPSIKRDEGSCYDDDYPLSVLEDGADE